MITEHRKQRRQNDVCEKGRKSFAAQNFTSKTSNLHGKKFPAEVKGEGEDDVVNNPPTKLAVVVSLAKQGLFLLVLQTERTKSLPIPTLTS